MRLSKTLAAILMAGSLPLFAGSAAGAPLSQMRALDNADMSTVEQVQSRRWRNERWIGPAAGFAAGVAIGSALAPRVYDDGYYAYGAAPGYVEPGFVYEPTPRYSPDYPAPGSSGRCSGDRESNSAYPSWMCR